MDLTVSGCQQHSTGLGPWDWVHEIGCMGLGSGDWAHKIGPMDLTVSGCQQHSTGLGPWDWDLRASVVVNSDWVHEHPSLCARFSNLSVLYGSVIWLYYKDQ